MWHSAAHLPRVPDGVVDDELTFGMGLDGFVHGHRRASGISLIESFADSLPDLSDGQPSRV
ncbi:hypothetical protein ACQP2U_23285 [Nocardia sp. CA-084685]|uniref:hypothetical protein n=1 Tax=Nocardia sp. CA-084685 TaxID=3239970 RepID=UPI003D975120